MQRVQVIDDMVMMLSIFALYGLAYGIIYLLSGLALSPFVLLLIALYAGERFKRKSI